MTTMQGRIGNPNRSENLNPGLTARTIGNSSSFGPLLGYDGV